MRFSSLWLARLRQRLGFGRQPARVRRPQRHWPGLEILEGRSLPSTNGLIAFENIQSNNREIFVINPDGSGLTNLTVNLTVDEKTPAWSPDGARIAFESNRDGNPEIHVMNADGSGEINLTNHPEQDAHPAWSPDGTRIAFQRRILNEASGDFFVTLFVMNADGSGVTQLTDSRGSQPVWSPDGTRIAFVGDGGFYVIGADGSGLTQLTNHLSMGLNPAWSPDGTQIAFTSTVDGNFEIYAMNAADGSGITRLTNDPSSDRSPAWSPDGTRIAFASDRDGAFEIYTMNVDGSGQTRVTTLGGVNPSWQPLPGTNLTVSTLADGGPGSLRQALLDANANPGPDTITFSVAGTIDVLSQLPFLSDATGGTTIDGTTAPGYAGAPVVQVQGPGASVFINGLHVTSANNTIRALAIGGFMSGIEMRGPNVSGNVVVGSYLGNDGSAATPNGTGITIVQGAHDNTIGGVGASDANVISGNTTQGVLLTGAGGNAVVGNRIGTSPDGLAALGNGIGIRITGGATNNRIGTNGDGVSDAAERNVISGNSFAVGIDGIFTASNQVAGNHVGLDATGAAVLPNTLGGISIHVGAQQNTISGNVVSGNTGSGTFLGNGIFIHEAHNNVIRQNFIGTDATGTIDLGNAANGILITSNASGNLIHLGNVISGNGQYGVEITAGAVNNGVVNGNEIGTNAAGAALGNSLGGVRIQGSFARVLGNRIAFNGGPGVEVVSGISNEITTNRMFANAGLGIDLVAPGDPPSTVTANDALDADTGANGLQNFPVLTSATWGDGTITLEGTLHSSPNSSIVLEFHVGTGADPSGFGEGEHVLGVVPVTTDANGNAGFTVTFTSPLPVGGNAFVTATATLQKIVNNTVEVSTSEFSAAVQVSFPAEPAVLTGFVYLDANSNGVRDGVEAGINGVTIQLYREEPGGGLTLVDTTTTTTAVLPNPFGGDPIELPGAYGFTVLPGTYRIVEIQPAGYRDGLEQTGALGGTLVAPDTIAGIFVPPGLAIHGGYNFGERPFLFTGGGTGNWSDPANWGGSLPTLGAHLAFGADAPGHMVNDLPPDTLFGSITFSGGNHVVTGNRLALGEGGITVLDGVVSLDVDLHIDPICPPIVTASGSQLTLTGVLSGPGGLHKDGLGTVILSGANTFAGEAHVAQGVLRLENALALGSTAVGTEVMAGAGLELAGGISVNGESLTLNPDSIIAVLQGLRSVEGGNSWSGPITLAQPFIEQDNLVRVGVDPGSRLTLSGIIGGTSTTNLEKVGAGTLVLGGANTYAGKTVIGQGTVRIENDTALGSTAGPTDLIGGATLESLGDLTLDEPLAALGNPRGSPFPGVTVRNLGGLLTISEGLNLNPLLRFEIPSGTILVTSELAGNDDIIVEGPGTLILTADNDELNGSITLLSGTLLVDGSWANVPITVLGGVLGGTGVVGPITLQGGLIQGVVRQASPGHPGQVDLVIGGTNGDDQIRVARKDHGPAPDEPERVQVLVNGHKVGEFALSTVRHLIVHALAGNDTIRIADLENTAFVLGGDGNDVIQGGAGDDFIDGGAGHDVLDGGHGNDVVLGGDGVDILFGGWGRDILLGGLDSDLLHGGDGDDILLGGTTAYDHDPAALHALRDEWSRTDLGYEDRLAHLRNGGGLNGAARLTATTVADDLALDLLLGGDDRDWFWTGLFDLVPGRKSQEKVN